MLRRLLVVNEGCIVGGGDFVHVQRLFHQARVLRPEMALAFAGSSHRGRSGFLPFAAELRAQGIPTLDLKVGPHPSLEDFRALGRLRRFCAEFQPGLVHAHSSKAGVLCRLGKIFLPSGVPVIYTAHGYNGLRDRARQAVARAAFRCAEAALGRVGKTIHVSADEQRFAEATLHLPHASSIVLHLGIELGAFRPAATEEKQALRARLGIPGAGGLLVTVGRAAYQKNYEPLYQALPSLLSGQGAPLHFAHAGAGSAGLAAELDAGTRARVSTFEHLERPQDLLRAADGSILLSRWEAVSLAVMEALACGLQVFLTRVSGLAIYEDLGFGSVRFLDPSPAELEALIVCAVRDWAAGGCARPGVEQVALATRLFDEKRQFEKLFALYDQLAEGRPPRGCSNAGLPPDGTEGLP